MQVISTQGGIMKEKLLETALTLYHVRYGCHGHDYHLARVDPLAAEIDGIAKMQEGLSASELVCRFWPVVENRVGQEMVA